MADQSRQRLAELHQALTDAHAWLYGVATSESWKGLGYSDWDAYVQGEVLPRLLGGPVYELLIPSLATFPQQHPGSGLEHVVHALLNQARRLLAATPWEELRVHEKQVRLGNLIHRSPVTNLDLAIQQLLVDGLRAHLGGDIGVYAEEGEAGNRTLEALGQATCVVIDPIDRTKELVLGRRGYSINVAVLTRTGTYGWTDFPRVPQLVVTREPGFG